MILAANPQSKPKLAEGEVPMWVKKKKKKEKVIRKWGEEEDQLILVFNYQSLKVHNLLI